MTVEFSCGQCNYRTIGTAPELDEGKTFPMMERPGVKAAFIVDRHFTETGHTVISGEGERTLVQITASESEGLAVQLSRL